jgi:hypothetical protein
MTAPKDNADEFVVHPIDAVGGVLPDRAAADAAVEALIPAEPGDRQQVGRILVAHGGHSVYWFGFDRVESLSGA